MKLNFTIYNVLILASIIIYFIFDFLEKRKIHDEREELIKLKTFELVQKTVTFSILGLSIVNFLYNELTAAIVIVVIILASLYTEIIGKLYFRKRY